MCRPSVSNPFAQVAAVIMCVYLWKNINWGILGRRQIKIRQLQQTFPVCLYFFLKKHFLCLQFVEYSDVVCY